MLHYSMLYCLGLTSSIDNLLVSHIFHTGRTCSTNQVIQMVAELLICAWSLVSHNALHRHRNHSRSCLNSTCISWVVIKYSSVIENPKSVVAFQVEQTGKRRGVKWIHLPLKMVGRKNLKALTELSTTLEKRRIKYTIKDIPTTHRSKWS